MTELTNEKIDISKYHLQYCQSKHQPDKALSEPYPCDCGLEALIHQAEIKAELDSLRWAEHNSNDVNFSIADRIEALEKEIK